MPPALHERRPTPVDQLSHHRPHLMRGGSPTPGAVVRQTLDLIAVVAGGVLALLPGAHRLGAPQVVSAVAFGLSVLVLLDPRRAFRAWVTTGILASGARAAGAAAIAAMLGIAVGVLAGAQNPDTYSLRLWIFTTALLFGLRGAVIIAERRARGRGAMTIPTLIVGAGEVGMWVARRLTQEPSLGLRPIGFLDADPPSESEQGIGLPVLGTPADVVEIAHETGAQQIIVAFSLERDQALAEAVKRCHAAGLAVAAVPRLYESMTDRTVLEHVGGLPLMSFEPVPPHGWQFALKHAVDRATALAACLVLAPLLLAIAFAVKRSSPGPVVYRQRRVGQGGREFDLLKFRSMAADPRGSKFKPSGGSAPGGIEGVNRRTGVGRWLRSTSLDELPQLINVVRGEMSLVGPRPQRPEFVARFSAQVPRYSERHRVRPGITGWAQVNGLKRQTTINDRVEWDNHYIDNWSLLLELRTLARTIAAVLLFRENAEASLVLNPAVATPTPATPIAASAEAGEAPRSRPDAPAPVLLRPVPLAPAPAAAASVRAVARPALALVGAIREQQLSDGRWFCGYCGAEPEGGTPTPWQRVCDQCSLGVLLEAEADVAPRPGDAFLVIDSRLTVQALSRRAEQILGVEEQDAANVPVAELLVDAAVETADTESLAAAIAKAASSESGAWEGFVRPRGDFGIRTRVRVTHCGPPRAALLVLEDVGTRPPLRLVESESISQSAQA